MRNQFFYTRKEVKNPEKPEEFKLYQDSFNINKVIRSVTHTDDTVIVILDDFNERVQEVPNINPKTNRMTGYKQVRQTVQSEIVLSAEDGARFKKLLNIEQE